MRRTTKSLIITLSTLFSFILVTTYVTLNKHSGGGSGDFYGTSREVSLNETVHVAKHYNLSIYLPFESPDDFECTAIYLS